MSVEIDSSAFVKKVLQDMQDQLLQYMANSAVKDYEEYKFVTGQLQAVSKIRSQIQNFEADQRRFLNDDEDDE